MLPCSLLSILKNELKENQIQRFDDYLKSLTNNELNNLTVSKVCEAVEISTDVAAKILYLGYENGLFQMKYAVRCPNCGALIKEIEKEDLSEAFSIDECYICDEVIEITKKDIVNLFSYNTSSSPFDNGQNQVDIKSIVDSAQMCDTLFYMEKMVNELHISNELKQNEQTLYQEEMKQKQRELDLINKKEKIKKIAHLVLGIIAIAFFLLLFLTVDIEKNEAKVNYIIFIIPYILDFLVNGFIDILVDLYIK